MRRALATLLVAALACASARAESVDVQPHWHVGDHVAYRMTRESITAGEGFGRRPVTVVLDVVEATRDGWLVTWRAVPAPDRVAAAASDVERAVRETAALPMRLRLDVHGRLLEVVNWEQVRDARLRLADVLRRYRAARGTSPGTLDDDMTWARASVASEAAVRATQGYEPQVLLATVGHAYDSMDAAEKRGEAPDPMGASLAPVTLRFELQSLHAAAHRASLRVTQRAILVAARRGLAEVTTASAAVPVLATPAASNASITFVADVDLRTGWPRMARADQSRERGSIIETTQFERR